MAERIALRMRLHAGKAAEYERRHDEIWPELARTIRAHGISDYSIFLDEGTGDLFATMRIETHEMLDALADAPVIRRWWSFMADIMDTEPDDAPRATPLREVFRLD